MYRLIYYEAVLRTSFSFSFLNVFTKNTFFILKDLNSIETTQERDEFNQL